GGHYRGCRKRRDTVLRCHHVQAEDAAQADRYVDELTQVFETIAAMPFLARERPEFVPPVRIHVHDRHLIVYTTTGADVSVLRLLGGEQNWTSILNAADR